MGANAQTAVPAFTAGQVLTAAQVTEINTGIPVFATTITRDAAFGGSGEKVLAEGQYAYIEATNALQLYDGSAWATFGGGLAYVTQATPTAVNTISINNCFTSSYANYLLVMDLTTAVGSGIFTGRMRLSGTDATTNYASQRTIGQSATVAASANASGTDDFYLASTDGTNAPFFHLTMNMLSPALARATSCMALMGFNDSGGTSVMQVWNYHTTATAYDGITINFGGTSFTGTIRVYGYQNS
jgi:hypothetical protein